MQKLLILILVVVLSGQIRSQGISFFEGTWKDALAKAKAEDKLLFVDAFAKWCGPCKSMAKNVFTQEKVGEYFNTNFVNLKLDMEETDGVTFGHKYPVQAYPTLFFLDGDGKVVKTIRGAQQVDGLLSQAADAIKKNDKSGAFEAKYKEGDRSYDLVYNYVKALNAAGKPSLKISNEYLNSNPEITQNQKYLFLLEAACEADSKLFDQMMQQKKEIIALAGKQAFEEKCSKACEKSVSKAIDFEMEELLNETLEKYKKAVPASYDIFAAKSKMTYFRAFKKAEPYKTASRQLAKADGKNPETLEFIVQDILNNFEFQNDLVADAAALASDLLELKENSSTLQLYTKAMIKHNEIDRAVKKLEKLKEKAEKAKKDTQTYEGLLRYLQSVKS
ncbi:MAG: thioredoxin family protein [Saprospiraceae bacterium]|jgi:thiol-disulfide isomerase/thioredoxin|nr:thioredoxin family protein [Saprospiraceae bacterium]